jgi:hypothetical protein
VAVLFLYSPQLLLYIHGLHLLKTSGVLGRIWLPVVRNSCLLSTSLFLGRYGQASGTVVDVVALASKALEVVRNICSIDRGRVALLSLVSLLFPTGVK